MHEIYFISLTVEENFQLIIVKMFVEKFELKNVSRYTSAGLIYQPFFHDITMRIKNSWFIFSILVILIIFFRMKEIFETFFHQLNKIAFRFSKEGVKSFPLQAMKKT